MEENLCDEIAANKHPSGNIKEQRPTEILIEQYAIFEKVGIMAFCNSQEVCIPALTEFTAIG